jgi:excisionase family DNA binding protein
LPGDILNPVEVAAYLRLTVITVCLMAAAGELPGFKIGKSWRFDKEEVMKKIAEAKSKAEANFK